MSFLFYKSAAHTGQLLPAGSHEVVVVRAMILNSFTSLDKQTGQWIEDADRYPWDTATDQLMLVLEDAKKRQLYARLSSQGYQKSEDFTPEQLVEQELEDHDGFVARALPDGKLQRLVSEPNTAICHNIINKLFDVAEMEHGSNVDDFIAKVVGQDVTIGVKVKEDSFNGKTYRDVAAFFRPGSDAPASKQSADVLDM